MDNRKRAQKVLTILRKVYKREPQSFVHWSNPLELVIATVLSAQCTDKMVNKVTAVLFKKYKTAQDYADARLADLEVDIKSTGFYRTKAKYLKGIGTILVDKHSGEIPKNRESLLELPGVSFKTANLVMAKAFGQMTGIAVDTHVNRVAPRLGFTGSKSANKKAEDLEALLPKKDWLDINEFLILHGRAVCAPRKPKCLECPVRDLCPSADAYVKEFYSND